MLRHLLFWSLLLLFSAGAVQAQKVFLEGTITYRLRLETADHKEQTGTYTFTFKGTELRKELKLAGGYEDIVILNTSTSKGYSLQVASGKKYAIELDMNALAKQQREESGTLLPSPEAAKKKIAGYTAQKVTVRYTNGNTGDVYITRDWKPSVGMAFEQFPNADFLPLWYQYKNTVGVTLYLEASSVEPGPVESSLFRIPADYKMISNAEFRDMTR